MTVFDQIKEIIVKELQVDPEKVTPEASLKNDLGADSLDAVEIIMDIEDEFDVQIADDQADSIQTVGDLVKYIETLKQ